MTGRAIACTFFIISVLALIWVAVYGGSGAQAPEPQTTVTEIDK